MNLKKQLFFAMAAALSLQMATAQTGVPEGMEITAQEWCANVVAGWNLGNSFECAGGGGETWNRETWWFNSTWNNDVSTWDTAWGNPATTKSMIDAVKAAGFNAVRIPVRWFPHITKEDDNVIEIDAQWLNRVKQVVDWCLANDMYVLLNTHHEHWLEYDAYEDKAPRINTRLRKLWTCLANEFKSYDGRLAFAGVNEVTDNWKSPTDENKRVLNGFHKTFVEAVRATGGNNKYRNLVVQTYACDPGHGFNDLVIPQDVVDNRMSVEFHYYQPWDYCGKPTTNKWTNVAGMESVMNRAKTTWADKGYGVIVGEYGCVMHYDESASAEVKEIQKLNTAFYNQTICQIMRANGFAGFVWDSSNFGNGEEKFGIFNRQSGMRVDNKYALAGIVEGAGITDCNVTGLPSVPDDASYFDDPNNVDPTPGGGDDSGSSEKPEIPAVPNLDPADGTEAWSGNDELNWGQGQLHIEASKFADLEEYSQIVFYYTGKNGVDYRMIQLRDKNWSETNLLYFRGNDVIDCSFSGLPEGEATLYLTIPASTLATLKDQGLNIQGYGVMLTKVVLINSKKDNEEPGTDPDPEQPSTDPVTISADWYHNAGEDMNVSETTLTWGTAIKLSAEKFSGMVDGSNDNLLVIFYHIDGSDDVTQQVFNVESYIEYPERGWEWVPTPLYFNGKNDSHKYVLSNARGSYITAFAIPSDVLTIAKEKGLLFQGNGGTLTGVVLVNANEVNNGITGDANADHKVDIADVVSVITYLQKVKAGKDVDWIINRKSADVNTTAGVDNDDVKGIADIILAQ